MCNPVKLEITVDEEGRDYQGGNFLNAINELVCFFTSQRCVDKKVIAEHLKLYAENMEIEE